MAASADGRRLATAFTDRTVTVWRLPDGVVERTVDTAYGALGGVALTPDGEQLVVGAGDAGAHVHRVADGEELGAVRRHGDSVTTVRFVGADRLLTLSHDGTAAVTDCLPCRPFDQVLAEAMTRDREGGT
jgi:WD40 repeat protein